MLVLPLRWPAHSSTLCPVHAGHETEDRKGSPCSDSQERVLPSMRVQLASMIAVFMQAIPQSLFSLCVHLRFS